MVCFIRLTGRDKLLSEGLFDLKDNPGPGLCCVRGCKKKFRLTHPSLKLCHKHYQERWRAKNPKQAAFATLVMHCKARKIPCTISFDYFCGLCDAYRYFDQSVETRGEALTLDRVDASRGYEPGNLQILSLSSNVIKGNKERWLPENVRAILERKRALEKEKEWVIHGRADEWDPESDSDPF